MGLFSSNKGLYRSRQRASADLKAGRDAALGVLDDGYEFSDEMLQNGYDQAGNWLSDTYDQAHGEIGDGYDDAAGILTDRYGIADQRLVEGRDLARGVLEPWEQSGRNAQGLYDTALGLDGRPAQEDFYTTYADYDPFRAFTEEQANRQLEAQFNARGLNTSGKGTLALSRASLERGTEDLNNYLDRLERQGARGGQYAGEISGIEERTGVNRANLSTRLGDVLADNSTGKGTALGGLTERYGTNRANLSTNEATARSNLRGTNASDKANLIYGNAQQNADMRINTANAARQNSQNGLQTALSLGGIALRAAIPGAAGVSAIGNIAGGVNRLLPGYTGSVSP